MPDTVYPKMPSAAWRTLRQRASSAPSTRFTPATVAAMLQMANVESASGNIVRPLKQLGIVDDDGALTERGQKWRVDSTYPAACDEILEGVYPPELSGLTGENGKIDKAQVKTWLEHKGFGGSNARQMAATYAMIAERTLPEHNRVDQSSESPRVRRRSAPDTSGHPRPVRPSTPPAQEDAPVQNDATHASTHPAIHLDIQIHIPATATPEQIDHIFASMAKHLYQR